ncbi:hypothetical protein HU200_021700 [Digitaria exilis]|uniref:Uncharacterized protein n=1 Tax=Digitaria exilis TaxID=1010633 RepID=A0A835EZI6_9POAL|nr:hypothetical protein HU200_021700 [Digitaria exilis]
MAGADDGDDPGCTFSHCICRWRTPLCSSPSTPRVTPGRNYTFNEDDDDDGPTCSLLAGVVSLFDGGSSLRLHRFRATCSGRVLGRSGDALDVFADDVDYYKPNNTWPLIRAAAATRSHPNGRSLSLCLFSREVDLADMSRVEAPRPVELNINLVVSDDDDDVAKITVSPLPRLPLGLLMPTMPITAAGDLWAPYLTEIDGPSRLVMQRFDRDAGRWVEVADLHLPQGRKRANWRDKSSGFQGFAVVGRTTILLSLYPRNLFFTFDCSALAWAAVVTDETRWTHYVPIEDRSVYVEEMTPSTSSAAAPTGCCCAAKTNRSPTMLGCVFPFPSKEGTAFMAHLGGRIMCAVWIGDEKLQCSCDDKHVLITTFRVVGRHDDGEPLADRFVPNRIQVLHSTCRRLDLWPSKANGTRSHFKFSILHFPTGASVYEINILDGKLAGHDKTLKPHCTVDLATPFCEDRPLPCLYACASKSIYVVSYKGDDIYKFNLDTLNHHRFPIRSIGIGDIRLICRVGNNIVAITDCLQSVHSLSSEHGWMRHETYGIPGLERKVNLSGYVVLTDNSFLVSDADTNRRFLFHLSDNKWSIVRPYALQDRTRRLPSSWPGMAFLSERSVFAKGFIYTCSSKGLAAYEFIEEGESYFLGDRIDLQFSWRKFWERERMCLECVGEDTSSGAIMFCVVQGKYFLTPFS